MANPLTRFTTFLLDVREEMKHVSWPTREDVMGSALVVFFGVALLAGFISSWDFVLSKIVHVVLQ